jgi:hypothetical protein
VSVPDPPLTPEDLSRLAARAGQVGAELRLEALSAARRYAELAPAERPLDADGRAEVRELLERLAAQWREAEDLYVTELGEDVLPRDAAMLLGALEDSLVLALSDDGAGHATMLTSEQVAARVEELRARGVWPGLEGP